MMEEKIYAYSVNPVGRTRHTEIHANWKCIYCGKKFKTFDGKFEHELRKHTREEKMKFHKMRKVT
jgi:hypothetical protein